MNALTNLKHGARKILNRVVEVVHDGGQCASKHLKLIFIVVVCAVVLLTFTALTMAYVITSYLYRKVVQMMKATGKLFAKGVTRLRRTRKVWSDEDLQAEGNRMLRDAMNGYIIRAELKKRIRNRTRANIQAHHKTGGAGKKSKAQCRDTTLPGTFLREPFLKQISP